MLAGNGTWVYAPAGGRVLGRALAFATRQGRGPLWVITDQADPELARVAALLDVQVGHAEGRRVIATPAGPAPEPAGPAPDAPELLALLRASALEICVEHGVVFGEVRGLEAARVAIDEHGRAALYVGVGRFDQEANRVMYGDLPPEQALANAVSEVRTHRHRHAKPHPINRLARERWLRSQVLAAPALVGARALWAIEPRHPRLNLRDPVPAAALGDSDRGSDRVLVLASVGVDLELVPAAADLVDREHPARVVFVQPARDRHELQAQLAARLRVPAEFVDLEGDWPDS